MKRFGLFVIATFALAAAAMASPPSAAAVLTGAQAQAKKEGKNILVIFHASWCGWCKKLDAFLADQSMGKLMSDNFVIVHLDVQESKDKKDLENAGGEDLMTQWKGEGLPFSVVLDAKGTKLADSNLDPTKMSNIGYPAKPEEIAHFMKMLKTAPKMNAGQKTQIEKWLTEHAPKG